MISASEIKNKALKKYIQYLQNLVAGIPFERIVIPCDKKPSNDFEIWQMEQKDITASSKEKRGYGYSIKWQTVNHKKLGRQGLPLEISFDTEEDLLKFIRKETEVQQFKKDIATLLTAFPLLTDWAKKYPYKVIDNSSKWPDLLKVLTYFSHTPQPNLYIRELPIKVHTKFIEQNKGMLKELLDILIADYVNTGEKRFEAHYHLKYDEELIRIRFLDENLSRRYIGGLKDISLPISEFCALHWEIESVFIVENKMNFLTFPSVRNSLIIWGHGYGVATLKKSMFLPHAQLYYWGDLDAQGFEILSLFRGYFPQTQSLLMDSETFNLFFENGEGTKSSVSVDLKLTDAEQRIYQTIRNNNWRLEQEKIPQSYVKEYVHNLVKTGP